MLRALTATFQRFLRSCVTRRVDTLQQDKDIVRDLIQLNDAKVEDQEPLPCVRRALWGVLYAGDAGIVSNLTEGLAKKISVIVTVFEAADLTVSKNKAEAMFLRTSDHATLPPPLVIEAAGQTCKQTAQFYT